MADKVYIGKTLCSDAHIEAEVGGYAPLVTLQFRKDGCEFSVYLSPHAAAELGLMLISASRSAGGSALLETAEPAVAQTNGAREGGS